MKIIFTILNLSFLFGALAYSQNFSSEPSVLLQLLKESKYNSNKNISEILNNYPENKTLGEIYSDIGKYYASASSVVINNQGNMVAAGYSDGLVRVWNIYTGGMVASFLGHNGAVTALVFSNNDLLLASAGEDNKIKLWNVSTGAQLGDFVGHTSLVTCLAYSHDGSKIASGSKNKTIKIWSVSSRSILGDLSGHKESISSLDFSFDDSRIVSGSTDSSIIVWNTKDNSSVVCILNRSIPNTVVFYPDGKAIAAGLSDNSIGIWNSQTGANYVFLNGHTNPVKKITFSMDGKRLFSGGSDNTIKIWNSEIYEPIKEIKCNGVFKSISPSGSIAVLANGEAINLWNLDSSKSIGSLSGHTGTISSIAVSSDGKLLATGSWDKTIKLWDLSTGNMVRTLQGHSDGILSLAFSPDGERLVSGGFDNLVKIWAVKSGTLLYTFNQNTNFVWNVAFSPDGIMVASGCWDNTVRIWETATGKLMSTFGFAGSSIAFTSDSKKIITGGFGMLKIWDVYKGYTLKDLSGSAGSVVSLAASPNGDYFACGTIDRTLTIWDASSYFVRKTIGGLSNSPISLSFSKDGNKILTAGGFSMDIWDVYSGNNLQTLTLEYAAQSAKFSGDGKSIAVSRDRYTRLYNLNNLLTGYKISGQIIFDGAALKDVTVNLSGTANLTMQTDQNGVYSFVVESGGAYKVTPEKTGYSFSPSVIQIDNLKLNKIGNFSSALKKITISGQVLSGNLPVSNVTFNLSAYGVLSESRTTDLNGRYSFTVDATKSYSIKPSKTGYSFSPMEQTFLSLSEDKTQNFTAEKNTSTSVETLEIPKATMLYNNYPNPFNPSTNIRYSLSQREYVELKIYDVLGKEVKQLLSEYQQQGYYERKFDASSIPSGIYFCSLRAGKTHQVVKLILTK